MNAAAEAHAEQLAAMADERQHDHDLAHEDDLVRTAGARAARRLGDRLRLGVLQTADVDDELF